MELKKIVRCGVTTDYHFYQIDEVKAGYVETTGVPWIEIKAGTQSLVMFFNAELSSPEENYKMALNTLIIATQKLNEQYAEYQNEQGKALLKSVEKQKK